MWRGIIPLTAALAGVWLSGAAAHAQYPNRPITMLVPLAAGGGTDISARTVARSLEKEIGGHIAVINKTGAAGAIALAELARSKPDGYTLGIINTPGIVSLPIEREPGFTIDSFEFLAATTYDPCTISVLSTGPYTTAADFIADAKKRPGEVTVGTQGVGSTGHIAVLMLEEAAGIKLKSVPFTGSSTARNALLSGEISAVAVTFGEAMAYSKGTPWATLAVMAPKRNPLDPSIPTFAELGYPVDTGSLRGFGGPKGMPPEVTGKLGDALRKIANDPDFVAVSNQTFQPPIYLAGNDYISALRATDAKLRTLWKSNPWSR